MIDFCDRNGLAAAQPRPVAVTKGRWGGKAADGKPGGAVSASQFFGGFLEGRDEPAIGFPEGFSGRFGEGVEEGRGRFLGGI